MESKTFTIEQFRASMSRKQRFETINHRLIEIEPLIRNADKQMKTFWEKFNLSKNQGDTELTEDLEIQLNDYITYYQNLDEERSMLNNELDQINQQISDELFHLNTTIP